MVNKTKEYIKIDDIFQVDIRQRIETKHTKKTLEN